MEEIFALIFLFFAASLGALILWKLFDITRNSINKNKSLYDEERFDKLAKAFIQHRKDTDRRLQNIETILTESQATSALAVNPQSPASIRKIAVDEENFQIRQNQSRSGDSQAPDMNRKNNQRTG